MQARFLRLALAVGTFSLILPTVVRADSAQIYKTNCVVCHSANGSSESAAGKLLKAKDLRTPEVQKQTDAALTEIINKGKGKMPAFGAKINPDDMKALIAYLRELAKK